MPAHQEIAVLLLAAAAGQENSYFMAPNQPAEIRRHFIGEDGSAPPPALLRPPETKQKQQQPCKAMDLAEIQAATNTTGHTPKTRHIAEEHKET